MSLRRAVQLAVGALLLLLVVLVGGSLHTTGQMGSQVGWVVHTYEVELKFRTLESKLRELDTRCRGYLVTGREDFLGNVEGLEKDIRGIIQELKALTTDNSNQTQRLDTLTELVEAKLTFNSRFLDFMHDNKAAEARASVASGDGERLMNQIEARVAEGINEEQRLLTGRQQAVEGSRSSLSFLLYSGLVAGTLLSFGIMSVLGRRLHPLIGGVRLAEGIGQGDLTVPPQPVLNDDEIGQLTGSLNTMLTSLQRMTKETRAISSDLAASTLQISASVQEQAVSSRQQLSAVQETSATMEEISRSASQIAQRSQEVSATANATIRAGEAGVQAVADSVRAATAIREQTESLSKIILNLSEKTQLIGDIVASVEEITDRSTLLALNAAIQAAAAGGEGRTFAIVAGEMKLLADQSRAATVQVRGLLGELQRGIQQSVLFTEETVKRVEAGTAATHESERVLSRMAESIEEGARAFQQIGAATNQQQLAFEQVTEKLLAIRQATEQNEIAARQLRDASQSLAQMGERLQSTMSVYRLG